MMVPLVKRSSMKAISEQIHNEINIAVKTQYHPAMLLVSTKNCLLLIAADLTLHIPRLPQGTLSWPTFMLSLSGFFYNHLSLSFRQSVVFLMNLLWFSDMKTKPRNLLFSSFIFSIYVASLGCISDLGVFLLFFSQGLLLISSA